MSFVLVLREHPIRMSHPINTVSCTQKFYESKSRLHIKTSTVNNYKPNNTYFGFPALASKDF
jgi:hypothetical protein